MCFLVFPPSVSIEMGVSPLQKGKRLRKVRRLMCAQLRIQLDMLAIKTISLPTVSKGEEERKGIVLREPHLYGCRMDVCV